MKPTLQSLGKAQDIALVSCSLHNFGYFPVLLTHIDNVSPRSELQSGNVSVAQLASKVTITVGSGLLPLIYDLYEAKASERKVEMQTVLFRLADRAAELSEQLKGQLYQLAGF